jgi:hypothetical protein
MPKRKKPEEEVEVEEEAEEEGEEAEPEVVEEGDDEEDGDKEEDRRKRRRAVARRKGYRHLAHRAGYSAQVPSANAARDVTSNLVSLPETVRMCRWKPRIPNAVTYGGNMTEYKARMKLSTESLPPKPAAVARASIEVFARRAMNEAVQRAFDAGKTRVSATIMASVLRPVAPALDFSYMAPMGLIRHAQTTIIGSEDKKGPALGALGNDELQMKAESATLPKQIDYDKQETKKATDKKAARKKAKDKKEGEVVSAEGVKVSKARKSARV